MKKSSRNIITIGIASILIVGSLFTLSQCAPLQPSNPAQAPTQATQPSIDSPTPTHTEAIDMEVSVIDVGQGDSILVMSEGRSLLVDAGDRSSGDEVVAYLREQGVESIDYIVATHGDADHIGGMVEVLETFDVTHDIIAPELAGTTATYQNFAAAVEREPGVGFTTPSVGTSYSLGDATIQIIANGEGEKDTNDSSIVLRVVCGGKSALLPGDIPERVELQLVAANAPLDSDLLKAGHHGSKYSSSTIFLDAVSPDYVVISYGANNRYGHPAPEALERLRETGATLYDTVDDGTVVFLFSDGVIMPPKAA
ncbi:MAG: MBL fold metallo-hydrolase [Coriobacteriales bacterium]|jgi:competence protein ComEC|nr:MBL fold metallo-hydrolase [Coriobacteriales bacterium]